MCDQMYRFNWFFSRAFLDYFIIIVYFISFPGENKNIRSQKCRHVVSLVFSLVVMEVYPLISDYYYDDDLSEQYLL